MNKPPVLSAVVKEGKIVIYVPTLENGTHVELSVVSLKEPAHPDLTNPKTTDYQDVTYNESNGKTRTEHTDIANDDPTGSETQDTFYSQFVTKSPEPDSAFTDTKASFSDLNLSASILKAIKNEGYKHPSRIQLQAVPPALQHKDILGTAQTGSGKTAAFALPTIQLLSTSSSSHSNPRSLILAPTRELATQIGLSVEAYAKYTKLTSFTVYGGVSQIPQEKALKKRVDILVATPGRLLDLIRQGIINLSSIEHFILDEADRMMDMGFIRDIRKIAEMLPQKKQVMMFSATMPDEIKKLADQILMNPVHVAVDPSSTVVKTIDSSVFFVENQKKFDLLHHFFKKQTISKALVFTRTKYRGNTLVRKLQNKGIKADAIHSNKSQSAREKALDKFREGRIKVLVATDIASRGIDVDDISHVINYDMSNEAETYVHRIGRTARAGKSGVVFNFCNEEERVYLERVEQLIKQKITRGENYPFRSTIPFRTKNGKNKTKKASRYTPRKNKGSNRYSDKTFGVGKKRRVKRQTKKA